MSKDEVIAVAGGRVWTGTRAKENGLVDVLGNLDDAIQIAAVKAGVEEDFRTVYYPEQKSFLERLISEFTKDVQATYARIKFGQSYELFKSLERLKKLEGVMAIMPFEIEIK
jgi:protease-4